MQCSALAGMPDFFKKHRATPQIFVDWLSDQDRASDAPIARV
jgi:hypothetical protein